MNFGPSLVASGITYINDLVACSNGGVYVLDPLGNVSIPDNQFISP
jgi:hypothetical protein